jgi:hypothetical protein
MIREAYDFFKLAMIPYVTRYKPEKIDNLKSSGEVDITRTLPH